MTPIEPDAVHRELEMRVTGTCDAGCGKPATEWFGETACATCGDTCCVNVVQDSYDREAVLQRRNDWQAERIVHLARAANDDADRILELEDALRENHAWHQVYDEYGYPGSALEQTNRAALGLPPHKPPHTLGAVATRRLEDQIKDYQALLLSGTLELDVVLLSAVLCVASIQELRQFGLFTQHEAQLWRQHLRALFIAHRPADLDRFDAEMAQREFKEPEQ